MKNFYTENGLPINVDPHYFPENQYMALGEYDGRTTCNLHLKREPRFYSWVAFHNGWFELQRDGNNRMVTMFRNQDEQGSGGMTHNISLTGYLIKKGVGLSFDSFNGYPDYAWPIIRLAELYLSMAETAVEVDKLEDAKSYLNKIRKRAGIPEVELSWNGVATLDKSKMREIVRRERTIELYMEGHYGWDIRRWKTAGTILNRNPHGLNIAGVEDEEFFQTVEVKMARSFTSPKNYLLPIRDIEINTNTRMVQNPGY